MTQNTRQVRWNTMTRNRASDVRAAVHAMLDVFEIEHDRDRLTDITAFILRAVRVYNNCDLASYRGEIEALRKDMRGEDIEGSWRRFALGKRK
jgi:hypothetical protein